MESLTESETSRHHRLLTGDGKTNGQAKGGGGEIGQEDNLKIVLVKRKEHKSVIGITDA